MFHRPARSLENAMRLPSGLNRGCMSKAGPDAIRVARPPAEPPIGIV
jgi:hypothetical protein